MRNEMIDRITDILMSDGCGDSNQCEKTARRIFAAMRDPTDAMLLACAKASVDQHYLKGDVWDRGYIQDDDKEYWINGAKYGYFAMIDTILNDATETTHQS